LLLGIDEVRQQVVVQRPDLEYFEASVIDGEPSPIAGLPPTQVVNG
jgi:hypothetical protein